MITLSNYLNNTIPVWCGLKNCSDIDEILSGAIILKDAENIRKSKSHMLMEQALHNTVNWFPMLKDLSLYS